MKSSRQFIYRAFGKDLVIVATQKFARQISSGSSKLRNGQFTQWFDDDGHRLKIVCTEDPEKYLKEIQPRWDAGLEVFAS